MDAGGAPSPRELADRPPPGATAARASAIGAVVLCGACRRKLPLGTRSSAPPRGSVTAADARAEGTEVDHDSGGSGERGTQECGTVGGGGVLGAEKGRPRVWGAAAPTRDGRVWGAPAPVQDGADRGRRRTDVEGQPGRGRGRGFG
jgi:hypothetical protein